MSDTRLGEIIGIKEELIKKACSVALKSHKSPEKPYLVDKVRSSPEIIFSFPGSWSLQDWYVRQPFGETEINLSLFPSLRSVGNDQAALVNEAFLRKFQAILANSTLQKEVHKAITKNKKLVFTGHSSGAPIAVLAAFWALENCLNGNNSQITVSLLCVTFGSPLIGNHVFSHALRRENWSDHFIHFVMRYDPVPRVSLAPFSSITHNFEPIFRFFNPKSNSFRQEQIGRTKEASNLYLTLMNNAATVTSHAACNLMGNTNLLLETLTNFVELSPYRPFGVFIFCTGNGRMVVIRNPDAVLQLLFYSLQLSSEEVVERVAYGSLQEHLNYDHALCECLEMQNVVELDQLRELPLSADGSDRDVASILMALNDLGLSTRARLCLRAAGESEKRKSDNQTMIGRKIALIEEALRAVEDYRAAYCKQVGYYDAFKLQKEAKDFQINIKRLELAGIWDEIVEMLKRYELPDEFEGRKEWIELGTRYRRLVEPLDIANYYRHLMNEDTGPYLFKARPKRYRYTQRWSEHAKRVPKGASSESCLWAEVEELCISSNNNKPFEDVKDKVLRLEQDIGNWIGSQELTKDVFLEGSTFVKWWKTLPQQHRATSCIAAYVDM